MVRCDGCGRWAHIKCLKITDFDNTADFICIRCLGYVGDNDVDLDCSRNLDNSVPARNQSVECTRVTTTEKIEGDAEVKMEVQKILENLIVSIENDISISMDNNAKNKSEMITGVQGIIDNITVETGKSSSKERVIHTVKSNDTDESFRNANKDVKNDRIEVTNLLTDLVDRIENRFLLNTNNVNEDKLIVTSTKMEDKSLALVASEKDAQEMNAMEKEDMSHETVTVGLQFKNKRFQWKINNILKGKTSTEEVLYGMLLKMKEKVAMLECAQQQGTIKKRLKCLKCLK